MSSHHHHISWLYHCHEEEPESFYILVATSGRMGPLISLKSWGTAVDKRGRLGQNPELFLFVWEPSCSDYTGLDVLRYQQGTGRSSRCFCWGYGSQPAVSPQGNWPLSLTQSHLNILNLLTLAFHVYAYHSSVLKNLFFDQFIYVYCIFIMMGIIPILRHT